MFGVWGGVRLPKDAKCLPQVASVGVAPGQLRCDPMSLGPLGPLQVGAERLGALTKAQRGTV